MAKTQETRETEKPRGRVETRRLANQEAEGEKRKKVSLSQRKTRKTQKTPTHLFDAIMVAQLRILGFLLVVLLQKTSVRIARK